MADKATPKQTDAYETATYYDCQDSESLTHESPEEAILDYLDYACVRVGEPIEETAARICPLVVTAHVRHEVSDAERQAWALRLADSLAEHWGEEYDDPDDPTYSRVSPDVVALLRVAVDAHCAEHKPWPCDKVGERVYSLAEVVAMAMAKEDDDG